MIPGDVDCEMVIFDFWFYISSYKFFKAYSKFHHC